MRAGTLGAVWLPLLLAACPERLLSPGDAESRLRAQLQGTTQWQARLAGGEVLELQALRFSEVTVSLRGDSADVLMHAEASGLVDGVPIHYTGSERLAFKPDGARFSGVLLPALGGVLEAVGQRQRAIAAQDQAALIALAAEDYHDGSVDRARLAPLFSTLWPTVDRAAPSSVAVRVDGERATVSLGFGLDGGSRTHTLALEHAAKSWLFSAGLL